MKAYRVAAVFEVGMSEYDNSFIYMPLAQAQIFFRKKGVVSGIEVLIDDPDACVHPGVPVTTIPLSCMASSAIEKFCSTV